MVLGGQYDLVVAGGVETMTRVPLGTQVGISAARTARSCVSATQADLTSGEFPNGENFHQGVGAERIARAVGA